MAKHLGFFNLDSLCNLFEDRKFIRSPGLVKTISNFNKARARLLRLGKHKCNEDLAAEKNIPANQKIDIEDLHLPVNRPKRCFCNKPKSQSKLRSRINDIGSITRLVPGKKKDAVIINQQDIENTRNQSAMSNPRTKNSTIFETTNSLDNPEQHLESLSEICKTNQNQSRLSNIQAENEPVVGTKQFNSLINVERISENIARISKANGILPETESSGYDPTSRALENRGNLEEKKSSIKCCLLDYLCSEAKDKSQKSLNIDKFPQTLINKKKTIDEIYTKTKSQKPETIDNRVIDKLGVIEELEELETASVPVKESIKNDEQIQPIVDFETVIEQQQPVQFEVVKISRKEFCNLKQEKNVEKIIRIDHKTSPPDTEFLSVLPTIPTDSHEEWKDVPVPVINEIQRVTKLKRSDICSKACPCKLSQELINIYHEAKLLLEVANKIGEERNHCKFRMTSSEIDFFKGDNKMCNVILGETQNRRAEMRELMDMWQEANEKLTIQKKETFVIAERIERTCKRIKEIDHLLKDWLPEGQMEKLRKAQRAAEKRNQEKVEMLEDETRIFCQKKIEEFIKKREARQAEEKLREEKRKNQRQKDTLSLQNATNLLQKYIDERKSLLI